ncbi:MAG: ABC transporter ATP-binding protein [Desulfuromonadales bacterium]|jgi:branched-chain amino acid transport system ATP-binding protein|nr:ABC transporter ATP-binding protein [Desulfuromonadales bacterium]MDH3869680.1 ABC transporter ATP-binding protein [Desulfuromonadales bacterium]MDH3960071.1 ABC transporter ATP-binding protein [Desulfuromonadales bacterium]MDH4024078.1 ABC transporter ATP-binding protein [Desulfuromonadales bacterium]
MAEPLLRIESLCKSFGAVKACHDLSLEIHAGEIHALIGPNGAGKTTLLNQIAGDLTPDSGQIFLAGQEITHLPLYRRAPLGLARSYQITSVFANLSVEENMLLAIQAHHGHSFRFWGRGLKDPQLLAELGPAIETVGLSERAETIAGNLSHGEKKQLEVGMALSCKPQLLLLDEPMAGMGPGGSIELSKLIHKLKKEMTILLVEHDMEAIFSLADRITVLVYGEVVATGSVEEIRSNPAVRQAYLGEED